MVQTQTKTVLLKTKTLRFISSEADLDREPTEHVIALPASLFRSAIALAETQGWRAPRRDYTAGDCVGFAAALSEALSLPIPTGRRSHLTSFAQLRAFFDDPARLKQLKRLVAFLGQGVGLEVADG